MKKLSLSSVNLNESNVLSGEEKRITLGGYYPECVDGEYCPSMGWCVSPDGNDYCPGGTVGGGNSGGGSGGGRDNPCVDGEPLPSGNCVDPF